MIDDLEARLGADLRRLALPSAPDALRTRVLAVPVAAPRTVLGRRSTPHVRRLVVLGAAAAIAIAVIGTALVLSGPKPIQPGASAAPPASPSPSTPVLPPASLPTVVDGQQVLTVSEAIAKRDAGDLGADAVAIRGFWSAETRAHSCSPPDSRPGELEFYCNDRESGITELNERITIIDQFGYVTEGVGPWLTPYFDGQVAGMDALFGLPIINGQPFPPVPIVVVGRFNDPRAADCRPVAKELCRDRLVVGRIVAFAQDAVATPAPTPTPTPFPFADPPPPPYAVDLCAEGHPTSFVGWKTLRSLGIDIGYPDEVAYIVITQDPIPIGDWYPDATDSTRYRLWGQRVCYGYVQDPGAVGYTAMPGTLFREYPDGRHEPTTEP